jgi:hypothetical protein
MSSNERGTHANVDGLDYWWFGSDQNNQNSFIEKEIERILEETYRIARMRGIDVKTDWNARIQQAVVVWQIDTENE